MAINYNVVSESNFYEFHPISLLKIWQEWSSNGQKKSLFNCVLFEAGGALVMCILILYTNKNVYIITSTIDVSIAYYSKLVAFPLENR
jgi:hypothetical protein